MNGVLHQIEMQTKCGTDFDDFCADFRHARNGYDDQKMLAIFRFFKPDQILYKQGKEITELNQLLQYNKLNRTVKTKLMH